MAVAAPQHRACTKRHEDISRVVATAESKQQTVVPLISISLTWSSLRAIECSCRTAFKIAQRPCVALNNNSDDQARHQHRTTAKEQKQVNSAQGGPQGGS